MQWIGGWIGLESSSGLFVEDKKKYVFRTGN
jgi:hypothetical protein